VASARQEAAAAVIVASATTPDGGEWRGQPIPALVPLVAIAGSCAWGGDWGHAGRERLAQWCVLQFEAARDSGAVGTYLRFLGARIADARWAPPD